LNYRAAFFRYSFFFTHSKGSGKCADIFAFILKAISTNTNLDDSSRVAVLSKISHYWPHRPSEILLAKIEQTLQYPHLLSVFSDDESQTIDVAILNALLKAETNNTEAQLKLSLAWDRADIGSVILDGNSVLNNTFLNELALEAITNNKLEFVKVLAANGVNLKEVLTVRRLLKMYNSLSESSVLFSVLSKRRSSRSGSSCCEGNFTFSEIGQLIQELLGNNYKHKFTQGQLDSIGLEQTVKILNKNDELLVKV